MLLLTLIARVNNEGFGNRGLRIEKAVGSMINEDRKRIAISVKG